MRVPQKRTGRAQSAKTLTVSSPVGGWNARDPISEMKDSDAVILDNWFCTPYDVQVRKGMSEWATGMSGTINTLASYSPVTGSAKLFAAVGANVYDVSSFGVVGAAVLTGRTSDKWQTVNFGTAGGNFLIMVNGADKLQGYTGAAWWRDGDGTHDITGVDSANLINVAVYGKRLWFTEKNSLKVWYLPTLSIGGAATSIDFSGLFDRGGYMMAMGDWSLDAGYGMDDYAVFITSEGQVAVYKGTDPSSTATWALIGVYDIGAPIGRRCMVKYGGDLLIICRDGLAPLSKTLMSSRVNTREMLTDRIQHVMSDYVTTYGANFGWETTIFPNENMILVNVPISSTQSYQLVMNTISGAWSRFTGWNAASMTLHSDLIYYGGNGKVYKAWNTYSDAGTNIVAEALQSFNFFGSHTQLKKVEMIRPIISTDGIPSVLLGVNADFDTSAPTGVPGFTPPTSVGTWDSALWDTAVWGGDVALKRDWQTAFAMGYSLAAHIITTSKDITIKWASTDYVINTGGVI